MGKLYYTLFNFLALTLIVYTGVDAFYRIVRAEITLLKADTTVTAGLPESRDTMTPPASAYRVIGVRNLFGSVEKAAAPAKTPEIETLEPTTLKVVLLGTVAGDQGSAVAVIEETDKRKQGLFRVGDSVQNAIVKMILRGKVVLRVGERDEILNMAEPSSVRARGAGRELPQRSEEPAEDQAISVSRAEIENGMKDVNALLSKVRIRPHFKNGKADGLAVYQIQKDSIFSNLGLRDGDIVQGVDDTAIQSPDDIISVYRKLESGSQLSIKINRRGQEKTLNYVIE